jgi:drug/metabolite transporter (DMT)-like permease
MTPAEKRNRTRILVAFAAVYFIWGSTFLFIKFAVATIPPFLMAGSRFVLAGALLYAGARWRGAAAPTSTEWRIAIISGLLMIAGGNGAVVWASQTLPSGLISVIVATVPLWMVVIDWLRPRGRRPRLLVFVGIALGLAGIVLLIGPAALLGQENFDVFAAGLVVAGSLSWAAGSIATRRAERPRSLLVSAALQMVAGGVAFMILSIATGELARFSFSRISMLSLAGWVYLIGAGSIIGYTAYNYLLGTVSAAKAATYAYVNPVVALVLGWLFANEDLTWRTGLAAVVILVGVAIITATQSSSPQSTDEHPVPTHTRERSAA